MSVKFIHIRPGVRYDTAAKKLVGEPLPKGGYTIAFTYDPLSAEVDVSVAQCHHRDSYSRTRGRLIAGGRLQKEKIDLFLTHHPEHGVVEEVVLAVGEWLESKELEREAA